MTVTNIQSIPYEVRFLGAADNAPRMSMHGDHLHFALGDADGLGPEVRPLRPVQYDDPQWKAFASRRLASGAFPIGLAPRKLVRKMAEYAGRHWPVAGPVEEGGRIVRCGKFQRMPPDVDPKVRDNPDADLEFFCIDGGVIDNEPLEAGPRIIDGERDFAPQTRGDLVDRALIAIAPFPELPTFTIGPPRMGNPFLLSVLAGAMTSAVNQARFDPKFAIAERDPEAFHRFMISAKRDQLPPARTPSNLACASLGGVGGFFREAFRAHDFQLGRRNCQQFLRSSFALPDEETNRNPLFASGWSDEARDHFRIVAAPDGRDRPRGTAPVQGDQIYLPIIPLWGTAAEEVPLPDWPRYDREQLETLRCQVEGRIDAVTRRLVRPEYVQSPPPMGPARGQEVPRETPGRPDRPGHRR